MNQVEGGLASREVLGQRPGVCQIDLPDLYSRIGGPRPAGEFRRRADKTANHVAVVDQTRRQTAPDVPGSSCDRDTASN